MIAYIDPGSAYESTAPQLERLDERALLFLVTAEHDLAYAVASVRDGATTPHRHDITALLPRLGCEGVAALRAWCLAPRVLTPADVDVLCYALQLPLPGEPPRRRPPIEQPRAAALLRAIHANPAFDDDRMVYADVLLEEDDPHGELIALQVARARSGGEPTPHERALLQAYGGAIALPLTPYLRYGYELRRGFLGACAVDAEVPEAVLDHAAWSTVESIESTVVAVLTNPRLVAKRCVTTGETLMRLVEARRELPFETIVVTRQYVAGSDWRALGEAAALGELRTLAILLSAADLEAVEPLMTSRLGAQLAHLELQLPEMIVVAIERWRECFERTRLGRLVVRARRGDFMIALERGAPHRLCVLCTVAISYDRREALLALLRRLGSGVRRVELAGSVDPALRDSIAQLFPEVSDGPIAWWWWP